MMSSSRGQAVGLMTALVLSVSVVLLGTTILNVALPDLQSALHTSPTQQQWVLNAYTLTFAGFLLVSGVAGDRFGYRRVLVGSLGVFAVTAAIGSVAPSVGLLVAMRAVMGVAAAGIMPLTLAVISRVVPVDRRAGAITVWAACSGLSIAMGPLLGGALLSAGLWWGSVLALIAILAVIALVVVLHCVPDLPGSGAGELRPLPIVGSVSGVGLLIWGVLNGGRNGEWGAIATLAPAIAGLVVLAALTVLEARHSRPLADVKLFANGLFSVATVVLTVGSFAVYGYLYFTTFYFELGRGYGPLETGVLLIPLSAGLIAAAPASRAMVNAAGPRTVMAVGMTLTAAALVAGYWIATGTALWIFLAESFTVAFGFGLVLSPGTAAAMAAVPDDRAGAGSALLNTLRQIGSALGVAVLGSVLWSSYRTAVSPALHSLPANVRGSAAQSLANTLAVGSSKPSIVSAGRAAYTHAIHATSLAAAAICVVGVLCLLVTARRSADRRDVRATPAAASSGLD